MDEVQPLMVERVPPPRWIGLAQQAMPERLYDAFGEQPEWGFAEPWVHQALASPLSHVPMLQAPQPGDELVQGPLAYWSSLLHLLIYSFGWSRPDRGLRWWYEAGKPTTDARLGLISKVWDADGQLDWFAAWLWTTPWISQTQLLQDVTGYQHDGRPLGVDSEWVRAQDAAAKAAGIHVPNVGGTDPLHLSIHIDGPLRPVAGPSIFIRTGRSQRRAIMLLDSMVGWYRALATEGSLLPKLSGRSWHVDVVVKPVGWLGTFRQSRVTGAWFSGGHAAHIHGI